MPSFRKKALSSYLRTGCARQFRLNLYSDPERRALGMPSRDQQRAGVGLVGQQGYTWQDEKVGELAAFFGPDSVVRSAEQGKHAKVDLGLALEALRPYTFVEEAAYQPDTPTFRRAYGFDALRDHAGAPLGIGEARPDLVQVLPSRRSVVDARAAPPPSFSDAEGPWPGEEADALRLEVRPDGSTAWLDDADDRLRLRVIDIKLASEPGAHYFGETVYYAITLAAWLHETGRASRFVVVSASAVWPGTYNDSALVKACHAAHAKGRTLSPAELTAALDDDLEVAPFDTFAARLRRFFHDELPGLLAAPWQDLPWHVDYSCAGCDFLGYPWKPPADDPAFDGRRCWPEAQRCGHVSQVAGLSRGAAKQLGVRDLDALAALPEDASVFERTPSLRKQRIRFPGRARSLRTGMSGVLAESGAPPAMPKWPSLHLYLFLDYDVSSAITAAMGLRAFWNEPLPFADAEDPTAPHPNAQRHYWNDREGRDRTTNVDVFLVETKSLEREREQFLRLLRALHGILEEVRAFDERDMDSDDERRVISRDKDGTPRFAKSTYQIYLWDEAQRKHLERLCSRHLAAVLSDPVLRDLAWLFPPPELLPNPDTASTLNPVTLVSPAVQSTVAVPLPHHYTLFGVAEHFHTHEFVWDYYRPHPLYREPLSDLVPPERIHEMWNDEGEEQQARESIRRTLVKKLVCLGTVTTQIERTIKDRLNRVAAPGIVMTQDRPEGIAQAGHLLREFTRLNAALQDLGTAGTRALAPHEREASFRSARLLRRLGGEEKTAALAAMLASGTLRLRRNTPDDTPEAMAEAASPLLFVYALAPASRDLNARPGDIGFVLSPVAQPTFLYQHPYAFQRRVQDALALDELPRFGASFGKPTSILDAGWTSVDLEGIDRVNGWIVLRPSSVTACFDELEDTGLVDFSGEVMLDPTEMDAMTPKLTFTLQGIGRPRLATENPGVARALGLPPGPENVQPDPDRPAARYLWDGASLAASLTERDLAGTQAHLEACGLSLNPSQWEAWRGALSRRLSLVWGPPGTGKSQTMQALIGGALVEAHRAGRPMRVLVAANNYAAMENVLEKLPRVLGKLLPEAEVPVFRVRGKTREALHLTGIEEIVPATKLPSLEAVALRDALEDGKALLVVGSIPHQIHNLALVHTKRNGEPAASAMPVAARPAATQRDWFDLIVVDEASQMDVASSLLVVSKLAEGGALVLAGDDLQLPPIHQATAPLDLDRHVGSAFEFVRHVHGVKPLPLNVNYRSNETLVAFTRTAGYDPRLRAHSPGLRLDLPPLPTSTTAPEGWPGALAWTPAWAALLDPARPCAAFTYADDVSGQANDFEADAIAALVWMLHGRLRRQLLGELGPDGGERPPADVPYVGDAFWERAVGVVTPHKAQMSRIVGRLQALFPGDDPEKIRSAVDTVERFQGQQRDVVLASFGVGDPDLIRSEDEFLFSLRRFNVLASRARAKLVVLASQSLVDHLSNDADVLEESRLLKRYVETYCHEAVPITLAYLVDGVRHDVAGTLHQR